MKPSAYYHWTNRGTFRFEIDPNSGTGLGYLYLNEKRLGPYYWATTAARKLAAGDHDEACGFSPSAIGVPSDPEDWNGLK